jgi:hypothetical protein
MSGRGSAPQEAESAAVPLDYDGEIPAARNRRQRSHEATAVPIPKTTLDPITSVRDEMICDEEESGVSDRCLVWIIERHVAPPCQMTDNPIGPSRTS